jgi:hypothetical protein
MVTKAETEPPRPPLLSLVWRLGGDVPRPEPVVRRSRWVEGLTKAEAETLMDWLETRGCNELEVSCGSLGFAVRCLPPEGSRLVQREDGNVGLLPRWMSIAHPADGLEADPDETD